MARQVVHLELHTGNLGQACAFYGRLFGWRFEQISLGGGSYTAIDLGGELGGGVAECSRCQPSWLPYIEVDGLHAVTARARALGAAVLLEPREGPAGWRSVIAEPAGGEVALWQPKGGADQLHTD